MIKNTNLCAIKVNQGTIKELIQNFINGFQIVFIINENNELLGAVTEGDIRRFFSNLKKDISFNELFNPNIKHIVYNNDKQVFEDAEKIFASNERINNIPVINKKDELLFQIDKYSKSINASVAVNNILIAAGNGSLEYFLKSCGTGSEIVITGSDKESLKNAENIINKHYSELILQTGIVIKIIDEIDKIYIDDKKINIISLSWFGFMYLWNIKNFRTDIITAHELVSYSELKEINDYDKEPLDTFINIFRYNKVLLHCLNNNLVLFKDKLNSYGIKAYEIETFNNISFIKNPEDSALNLYLVSGMDGNEYIEKITTWELLIFLRYIRRYKQLEGKALEYNKFMQSCVFYIKELHNKGFDVFLQSVDSLYEQELHNNINKECGIEIITLWKDISPGKKYIIDIKNLRKPLAGNFVKNMKDQFLRYVCECSLYNIVRQKCCNVYICSKLFSLDNILYNGRNRNNFLISKEFFLDNFSNYITCGKGDEYLTQVIKDKAGCMDLKINDGYLKFTSNYHSKYFNTDLYGNRVVCGVPEKYIGTVWILGACLFSGYAVEDKHTTASYIQRYVNLSGYRYRVVNLSCDEGIQSYNKLLERNISINDIVIIQTISLWNIENFITIDYKELNSALKNKVWFWDIFSHMGCAGYEFIAKKIFNKIKSAMGSNEKTYNHKFYLEKELELKIERYITGTKKLLKENNYYNKFSDIQNYKRSNNKFKIGAIVMNCNPFTYGHQYLIETASRMAGLLYIFVVEEDKSVFSFKDRFYMVKEGTKYYNNVIVISSGGFMISSVTFPGYFMKDTPVGNVYDDFLDLKIFAHYIAPAFGISTRFVGEEPLDKVTAQYNHDMEVILKESGIDVIEIPRNKLNGEYISATKVRKLLKKKDYIALKDYLPETTIQKLSWSEYGIDYTEP